ncbi:uncharacterized protein LOC128744516 [Sabethes cyaneus]|uniref:uncharacterized protein LOC128744516 n=1 Tax=Sabethes cyaneus TaxID=53552 RepID=UPI00237DC5F5|nr:uncharacterized protein LOC128744516 [Sabethes cyaneus]
MIPAHGLAALLCLLPYVAVISEAALTCDHCLDQANWSDCERNATPAECGILLANDLHLRLSWLNPSLPVIPPPWMPHYVCYSVELALTFVAGSSRTIIEKGCTYDEARFCQGWDSDLVTVVNCTISETGVAPVDDGAVDLSSGSGSSWAATSWMTMVVSIAFFVLIY